MLRGMPLSGDPELDALHARVLSEEPVPADAIVWLQGNGYDRGPKALTLFSDGYAPIVVVTGNRTRSPITVDHLVIWLAAHGVPAEAVRIDAESLHTRDQAVHVLALAQEYGWRTLLLVGSPHHQLRAFLTFMRRAQEVEWHGRIANQPADIAWGTTPSGRQQTSASCFRVELMKLGQYNTHTASAHEGIAYLDATATAPQ